MAFKFVATVMVLVAPLLVTSTGFSFSSIGDWGCIPIGGWHAADEITIAEQFAATSAKLNSRFVLNTGDNFYYCGVQNGTTDPMWQSNYEQVFDQPSMMVPWYSCLGNHDYGYPGSATTQMEYVSPNNNRWVLPDRYYYKRLTFSEVNISLIVLDATPCQQAYFGDDASKWDPCGTVIPSCPGCTFHENVVKQSCSNQLSWLNSLLGSGTIPDTDWLIAMIHAPAGEIDVSDLITPLQNAGVQLVINGHVHQLAHYTIDNAGTYITSGAGCMVRIKDEKENKFVDNTTHRIKYYQPSSCPSDPKFHSCQVVWEKTIAGYTSHTFSEDFTSLKTDFYNYEGDVVYSTTTAFNPSSSKSTRRNIKKKQVRAQH